MNKLIVLVGLPASGKSTYANTLAQIPNTIVLSSDKLRKELLGDESCQTNNQLVFDTLYSRAKQYLIDGYNVVIDATNINMKDRKRTLTHFQSLNIERIALVFATPIEVCYARDEKRERTVGKDVIDKFVQRFEIPMEYEGFDKIEIIESNETKYNRYEIKALMNVTEQFNPHHKYTIGIHCNKCYHELFNRTTDVVLQTAGLWHDIGKLYTKTFDEDGIAHYYSHHNVGAYILLCSDWLDESLNREIIFYVNYHMNPFFWKEEKTHEKYKKLFGEKRYNNLMLLNHCDKIASGTQGEENGKTN